MINYSSLNYDNTLNKVKSDADYLDSVYNNEDGQLEEGLPVSTSSGASDSNDLSDDKQSVLTVSKLISGVFEGQEFIVESSGRIRSGQTAYDTGSGWWIGDVNGTKKLSIGNSAGNKLTWDGTTLSISGSLVAGDISIGTSPNWFRVDTLGNTWWGSVLFATAPASITPAGLATFNSASIGGWNVTTGYIYNLQSGTPTVAPSDGIVMASGNEAIMVYEDTAKRVELGYLSAGVYGLKGYATNGTDVIFELSDTQQKIAGFYFTDTILRSNTTDASSNIFIDSANSLIRAGATTGNYLTLDGANLRLRSSNYVSGSVLGAGFTLEPNLLEVGNISARGILRSTTFEVNSVAVHSGSDLVVMGGDVLATDMTALEASTLTIAGHDTFVNGDILRIKSGVDDEWLMVTDATGAPTYVVARDANGDYALNSNPAWTKGVSVTNYGQSGDGGIYLTADDTNAPYILIFSHTGDPWTSLDTQVRLGNLNGYLGYVADIYGFGAGSSTGTLANITVDTTNGIRIRKGTTNSIALDISGNLTVGEVGAGLSNTYISAGALSIRNNTTAVFNVDTSGNVLVGQTGASQSNVYITSGAVHLRNNVTDKIVLNADGTAFFAGSITVGDGTANSGSITLNHFATGGDTFIGGGTYTIADWTAQNGFLIGIDDSDSDKFKAYFGDSTTGFYMDWNVSNANKVTVNGSQLGFEDRFGDGSDGDVTISANTVLSSNMYYNNLTIQTGFTLDTSGFKIYVLGTLTYEGTGKVISNGNAGSNGSGKNGGAGGTAYYTAGSVPIPTAGSNGGTGDDDSTGVSNATAGTVGTSIQFGHGSAGAAGGAGGQDAGAVAGAAGGGSGSITDTIRNTLRDFANASLLIETQPSVVQHLVSAGAGGGGGAAASGAGRIGGGGGGGGSCGGFIWISAKNIVTVNGNVYAEAKGGKGGNGADGNDSGAGGGGGGGGGAGGFVLVIYQSLTGTGTIDVSGGAIGTGGASGGGASTNGTNGTVGNAGDSLLFQII